MTHQGLVLISWTTTSCGWKPFALTLVLVVVAVGSNKAHALFKAGLTETTNPYRTEKTSQTNRASVALYFQVETTERTHEP